MANLSARQPESKCERRIRPCQQTCVLQYSAKCWRFSFVPHLRRLRRPAQAKDLDFSSTFDIYVCNVVDYPNPVVTYNLRPAKEAQEGRVCRLRWRVARIERHPCLLLSARTVLPCESMEPDAVAQVTHSHSLGWVFPAWGSSSCRINDSAARSATYAYIIDHSKFSALRSAS